MFIEVENIRKSYGRKTIVLNGASFHAASGEYIAIVGANGCGKSTLLEILAGSLKADGGSLKIDGTDVSEIYWFCAAGESTYGEAVGKG